MYNVVWYPRPDQNYIKKHKEHIKIIKKILPRFKLIWEIFENYESFEDKPYNENHNMIINHLIYHGYDESILELLETSLKVFSKNLVPSQLNLLRNRIRSFEYIPSASAYDELTIAFELACKFKLHNVQYEPKINNKKSDIMVKFSNKEIYLELTILDNTTAHKKIDGILNYTAKYIYEKMSKFPHREGYLIIDTTKLIGNKDKNIVEDESKKLLLDYVDEIHIPDLLSPKFKYVQRIAKQFIRNNNCDVSLYDFSRMHNVGNIPHTIWTKKIMMRNMQKSPFIWIACDTEKSSRIRIEGEHAITNEEIEKIELSSLLRQIKNKIKYKDKASQYKNNSPMIIMIKCSNPLFDFGSNYENYSLIENTIRDALVDCANISGIWIYNSEYSIGEYFKNIHSNQNIKLSNAFVKKLLSK